MSHDIGLYYKHDDGTLDRIAEVERHEEGGTYVLGGTHDAELNLTYNYGRHMADLGVHVKTLHGQRAGDTVEALRRAVGILGTERDPDYWAATKGNAGHACAILLSWAEQHPEAYWDCS